MSDHSINSYTVRYIAYSRTTCKKPNNT